MVGDGEGTVGETVVDVGGGVPPPLSGLSVGTVVPVTAVGDTVSVTTAVGVSLCVYNRETIAANNLVSRAQEQRDDR